MTIIFTLDSDSELKYELSDGFRNRNIDQKFLYNGDGAKFFYQAYKTDIYNKEASINNFDISNFGLKNCFDKNKKNIFISLGCGNSTQEKTILENTYKKYNIEYIGIDSSLDMLEMSLDNFKNTNIDINMKFLLADFSKRQLKNELLEITNKNDNKVFTFFYTFGNINHTNIIDILYNILDKGDKIWISVSIRKNNLVQNNLHIFKIYEDYLKTPEISNFIFSFFISNNIPIENGYISRVMKEEKGINSLKIEFYFVFTKKTEIDLKGKIIFLPNEGIKFLQIYHYDGDSLINFFEEHNFKLIDKEIILTRGQFLFEKN